MINTTLIALGGQTASGKSEMAIELAHSLDNCWIVGCDSRQIYKYLNLGTGKVKGDWEMKISNNQLQHTFVYENIPHFFIDSIDPQKQYTLADFLYDFKEFTTNQPLPKYIILCGGTGLYIKSILERYEITKINPEFEEAYDMEKSRLETMSTAELQKLIGSNHSLNQSDFQNSRRLINKILYQIESDNDWGTPIKIPEFVHTYNFAIKHDQDLLYSKIKQRILDRIEEGMIEEVKSLEYLGTDRLLSLGLEYRLTHLYLLGQLSYEEYLSKLNIDSINYAQKQLTWLKKQPLQWIESSYEIVKWIQEN
jgi:tRNA dimethylallyltransferase